MPLYLYKCDNCGRKQQEVSTVAARRNELPCICTGTAKRDWAAQFEGFRDTPGNWPMLSDALGVNENQIAEARAQSVALGVPTDFAPRGQAVLTDRKHRKRYAEALGYVDRNGCYGDPQSRR